MPARLPARSCIDWGFDLSFYLLIVRDRKQPYKSRSCYTGQRLPIYPTRTPIAVHRNQITGSILYRPIVRSVPRGRRLGRRLHDVVPTADRHTEREHAWRC